MSSPGEIDLTGDGSGGGIGGIYIIYYILQIFIETQVCNAHLSYVTSKRWQD